MINLPPPATPPCESEYGTLDRKLDEKQVVTLPSSGEEEKLLMASGNDVLKQYEMDYSACWEHVNSASPDLIGQTFGQSHGQSHGQSQSQIQGQVNTYSQGHILNNGHGQAHGQSHGQSNTKIKGQEPGFVHKKGQNVHVDFDPSPQFAPDTFGKSFHNYGQNQESIPKSDGAIRFQCQNENGSNNFQEVKTISSSIRL